MEINKIKELILQDLIDDGYDKEYAFKFIEESNIEEFEKYIKITYVNGIVGNYIKDGDKLIWLSKNTTIDDYFKSKDTIKEELMRLNSDKEVYEYLIKNKLQDIPTIMLDNDSTYLNYNSDIEDDWCLDFKLSLGNSSGVDVLLNMLGLNYDGV